MRRTAIERLLPAMYQRAAAVPGGVLGALLDVMEDLHAPTEATLSAVDDLVAPYRTPDVLAPFLVGWVALDHVVPPGSVPPGRLRDLVSRGAVLAQWRGTAQGLCDLLETATGVPGFTVEEPPERPFHIVVWVPLAAAPALDLVRRIVEAEKPAATTAEVRAPDGRPGNAPDGQPGNAPEATPGNAAGGTPEDKPGNEPGNGPKKGAAR